MAPAVSNKAPNLGGLIAVHTTAPASIQRAAIVAILSFLFFLGMLVGFVLRQHFIYLILAAAFFVVNIFTLIGFMLQRRNTVRVYENGLVFRRSTIEWISINSFLILDNGELLIEKFNGDKIPIPASIDRLDQLTLLIKQNSEN